MGGGKSADAFKLSYLGTILALLAEITQEVGFAARAFVGNASTSYERISKGRVNSLHFESGYKQLNNPFFFRELFHVGSANRRVLRFVSFVFFLKALDGFSCEIERNFSVLGWNLEELLIRLVSKAGEFHGF